MVDDLHPKLAARVAVLRQGVLAVPLWGREGTAIRRGVAEAYRKRHRNKTSGPHLVKTICN